MKKYEPIRGGKLSDDNIKKLKKFFEKKYSIFTTGETINSVTKYGGIHYTGKKQKDVAVSIELRAAKVYYMITLLQYPKGVIFHYHIYSQDTSRLNENKLSVVLDNNYEDIKNIILS